MSSFTGNNGISVIFAQLGAEGLSAECKENFKIDDAYCGVPEGVVGPV